MAAVAATRPFLGSVDGEALPLVHRHKGGDLAENVSYRDDGCHVHPSCLSCPLERCIFDTDGRAYKLTPRRAEMIEATKERNERMARRALELPLAQRVPVLVQEFGLSADWIIHVLARHGAGAEAVRARQTSERDGRIAARAEEIPVEVRVATLAAEFGLPMNTILRVLKNAGLSMSAAWAATRRPGTKGTKAERAKRNRRIRERARELSGRHVVDTLAREFELAPRTISGILAGR